MPLSEDEKRILRQIEEQLQRDPGFGRTIREGHRSDRRALLLSASGALLCLALTVALLSVSPFLSFVAFVGAVAAALVCERHARTLGEAGLQQFSDAMRGRFCPGQRPGA